MHLGIILLKILGILWYWYGMALNKYFKRQMYIRLQLNSSLSGKWFRLTVVSNDYWTSFLDCQIFHWKMIASTRAEQENWRWWLYLWRADDSWLSAQETLRTLNYIERPATCTHTPSHSAILGGSIEHCPAMKFYYGVCNFDTMNDVAFANLRYELTTTGHENRRPTFNSFQD